MYALEFVHPRVRHQTTHSPGYDKAYRDSLLRQASSAEANALARRFISLLGLDRDAIPSITWQDAGFYRVIMSLNVGSLALDDLVLRA